jgi:hypothetical protein
MNALTTSVDINGEYKQVKALGDLTYGADADGIEITSDALTPNPVSIAFNSIGFTQDDGVNPPVSNTWDNLNKKIADLSAITNNNGNASQLCIKDTLALVDTIPPTTPVRTAIHSVGDPAVVGEFFGLEYYGTSPYTITESGTTNGLRINPTTTFTKPITATQSTAGGSADPILALNNTNATAGNLNGVPLVEYYKSGRNVGAGDVIASQRFQANNYLGTKRLFGRMDCVATSSSGGAGDDGALDFYTCIDGSSNLVFRMNGADNENNSFRPLDLNGNNLKTSSGNMTIETSASTGTGNITIAGKSGGITNITATTIGITASSILTMSATGAGAYISATANDDITLTSTNGDVSMTAGTGISLSTASATGTGQIVLSPKTSSNVLVNGIIKQEWTNGTDTSTILYENDGPSLNSAINMNYQTPSGNMGTSIQNIPSIQRIQQTDGINNKSYESSPSRVFLGEGSSRQLKIENSVISGENRVELFKNDGGGIVAQTGMVNQTNSQLLFLTQTLSGGATSKTIQLQNTASGALIYDNTDDNNGFTMVSNNTNLTLQTSSITSGQGDIIIAPSQNGSANGQLIFTGASLQDTTSTGSSGQYLKIVLNGVSYKIALDNP